MAIAILWVVVSLIILYFGADWLVKGSSSLATRFGVTPLVVGLTVVALGTSMPELIVSVQAALSGSPEISVGNVVGSNIFNIGVILGISALIYPLSVQRQLLRLDMPVLITAVGLFTVLFLDGRLGRWEGLLFFTGMIAYTVYMVWHARRGNLAGTSDAPVSTIHVYKHWWSDAIFIVLGLLALILGSKILVKYAVEIARMLQLSEAVIGLTIVAAGTSMPELATSAVAAIKKNTDIAIGNIVGSCIYNILLIMGTSALIKPIQAPAINYVDNLVMLAFTLALLPLMRSGRRLNRWEGGLLLAGYVVYMLYLLKVF